MLTLLHIENIALIESADIRFAPGFNVLTGETGAGKSIVVDSIGAVIGDRTSRDLIRTGARSALVSGTFSGVPALPWLVENGVAPDEEGCLLLQRELQPDGKNVCRINGRPVTVAQLRELGHQLLNIHGQHEGQQLLDESCHIDYLDSFGGLLPRRAAFLEKYRAVQETRRAIQALEMDEAERQRRMDTLTYQIGELERAQLRPGEEAELSARRNILRNAGRLMEAVAEAAYAINGDEDRDGAAAGLAVAEQALRGVARVEDRVAELADKAAQVRFAADELAGLLQDLRDEFEFSPDELDRVESRLDVIYRLKKKYGSTEEEMLDFLENCRAELEQIQDSDDIRLRLERKLREQLEETRAMAAGLTQARKEAALGLKERIEEELTQLDMPRVRFEAQIAPVEGELELDEKGADRVLFLMSANVGEDLKPVQKVASGGELARIMLAMKNVLAENDQVGTMVFDEVDTGVSGRAAQKVAEKLAQVARAKQVLCVTHLPQIAAMADVHFSVEKGERDGRTYTRVEGLDREHRMAELARLTSGDRVTDATRQAAGELLDGAERFKAERGKRRSHKS